MSPTKKNPGVRRSGADQVAPIYLVKGEDPSLVAQRARTLIHELVGDREYSLVVEEHGSFDGDRIDVGKVIDAYITPPFLVDRRVVVVREAGRINSADATRLLGALVDPPPSSVLVLIAGGGAVPSSLAKAATSTGGAIDTRVGSGRDRAEWVVDQLRGTPITMDSAARSRLQAHLGEDLGRLQGILQTLISSYGPGASVGVEELEPFLGEAGSIPPWDLTDAIDSGSAAEALAALHRMLGPGGRAPTELLGVIHRHFSNMLRLDEATVGSSEEAASLLGVRSSFVAKKALGQSRKLGTGRLVQAIALISEADLDIKGQTGLPPELVLEILVARLSRLRRGAAPAAVGR